MAKRDLRTDLHGRVKNLRLRGRDAQQPLFEAISNSFHAIENAKRKKGTIQVRLIRDPDQRILSTSDATEIATANVTAIEISDNGEGFTDENFESFLTLDSQRKAPIGGKGVGRLSWLKFFEEV